MLCVRIYGVSPRSVWYATSSGRCRHSTCKAPAVDTVLSTYYYCYCIPPHMHENASLFNCCRCVSRIAHSTPYYARVLHESIDALDLVWRLLGVSHEYTEVPGMIYRNHNLVARIYTALTLVYHREQTDRIDHMGRLS